MRKRFNLSRWSLRKVAVCVIWGFFIHGQSTMAQIEWPTTSITSAVKFDQLQQKLKDSPRIRGVVVIQHSQLQFEYYRSDLNEQSLHAVASVTKSVLSSLIGIATQTHQLNVNTPIYQLLDQRRDTGTSFTIEAPKDILLWHLLTFSTGFSSQAKDRTTDYFAFMQSLINGTILKDAWQRPRQFPPGQGFTYNNIEPQLVSMLLSQLTQQTAKDYAIRYLFNPLNITQFEWPMIGSDTIGPSELRLTTRDMAKLGQLWLQTGTWDGKTIIPSEYLARATQSYQAVPSSGTLGQLGYGYWFWIVLPTATSPMAFLASGHGGQLIYVVPTKKLVVAINSESTDAQHATGAIQTATILKQHLLPIFEN